MVAANRAVIAGTDTMLPPRKAQETGLEAHEPGSSGCTINNCKGPKTLGVGWRVNRPELVAKGWRCVGGEGDPLGAWR